MNLLSPRTLHVVPVIVVLAAGFFGGPPSLAAPPVVVRATPDHAESEVDPNLTVIRIEFDQDMKPSSYSICGSKDHIPDILGSPKWESPRVFVLPVKMAPGRRYDFSVNCPTRKNFTNLAGESAVAYPISFRTSDKAGGGPKLTAEQNRNAIAALRRAVDEQYSYRDLHKVDWKSRFAEFDARLAAAETPAAFAHGVAKLMSPAEDVHVNVQVGEFTLPTHRRTYVANWNEHVLGSILKSPTDRGPVVASGRLEGDIGYILVRSWAAADKTAFDGLYKALEEFKDAKALVIDVRPNGGGDELIAREFAGCFVSAPAVYSKNSYRKAGTADGFGTPVDRVVTPTPNRPAYRGPVAVLMGPANLSSNESFLLMMRHGAKAKLIGAKSGGSSGNPKPYDLGNGVTVMLSSWKNTFPDGSTLEGVGITPDVAVETNAAELATDDAVLRRAMKVLAP